MVFGLASGQVPATAGSGDRGVCDDLWYLVLLQVKYRQQLGVVTVVFVRRSLLPYCTSFESEVTKTGMGGWWVSGASVVSWKSPSQE